MGCRLGQNYACALLSNLAVRLSTLVSVTVQLVSGTVQLINGTGRSTDKLPVPVKQVNKDDAYIYTARGGSDHVRRVYYSAL